MLAEALDNERICPARHPSAREPGFTATRHLKWYDIQNIIQHQLHKHDFGWVHLFNETPLHWIELDVMQRPWMSDEEDQEAGGVYPEVLETMGSQVHSCQLAESVRVAAWGHVLEPEGSEVVCLTSLLVLHVHCAEDNPKTLESLILIKQIRKRNNTDYYSSKRSTREQSKLTHLKYKSLWRLGVYKPMVFCLS